MQNVTIVKNLARERINNIWESTIGFGLVKATGGSNNNNNNTTTSIIAAPIEWRHTMCQALFVTFFLLLWVIISEPNFFSDKTELLISVHLPPIEGQMR